MFVAREQTPATHLGRCYTASLPTFFPHQTYNNVSPPPPPPAGGREVVVNRLAGEAVLQGANVFAPGLLAASSGLAEGDLVAVTVALEQQGG